jgi:glycerate kinase
MKIVIAPDSFKGSLTAFQVAEAIETGFKRVYGNVEVDKVPIADGGEGTAKALVAATGGIIRDITVTGPLGDPVPAYYGVLGDGETAVVEMAVASGLPLVPAEKRNPLITTTYGTGELIRATIAGGIRRLIVAIGGSATNDGGAGMAQALGVRFLDRNGAELGFGGEQLLRLCHIDTSGLCKELKNIEVIVACDVTNPLTGPNGASAVYGPQKGATPEMVERLDLALSQYGRVIEEDLGISVVEVPGAGAAGGLGAGLLVFTSARLQSGIDMVLDVVGFSDRVKGASLVITAEGSMDGQTASGKAPVGVASIAKLHGVPVVALAGNLGSGVESVIPKGIDAYVTTVPGPISLQSAMDAGEALVADGAERVARLLRVGQHLKG